MNKVNYPEQEILCWFFEVFLKFDEKFFSNKYIQERIKRKIWVREILPDNQEMRNFKSLDKDHSRH